MSNKTQRYKDAVWEFLLEHCDITQGGSYFVKFHTSSRANFEKRVYAREKFGYHREDVVAKQQKATNTKDEFLQKKEEKAKRWEQTKKESQERQRIIKRNLKLLKWLRWLPQSWKEKLFKNVQQQNKHPKESNSSN